MLDIKQNIAEINFLLKHIEEKGLDVFEGVTDIFDCINKYCVATGGVFEKTLKKNFIKEDIYYLENIYTLIKSVELGVE